MLESDLFLESVVMVLDVDDAGDGLYGPVTGDVLPVAEVEVDPAIGRTLLENLYCSSHGVGQDWSHRMTRRQYIKLRNLTKSKSIGLSHKEYRFFSFV